MDTKRWMPAVLAATVALGVMTARVREADACGACVGPPPDPRNPTGVQTVTDHRMALALSATQTTLWDQFSWAGSPDQFSWILPVTGGADTRVELASDDFLTLLDNATSPNVLVPRTPRRECGYCESPQFQCPYENMTSPAPSRGGFSDASTIVTSDASAPPQDAGVQVFRDETLGPYELVVLHGNDSMALRDWLTAHGFSVPSSLEPAIQYYVGLHMDFVALRLAGTTGARRMQPVRVTVRGAQPTLPLRMVAGGVGDHVGLLLFVLASGRMEAQNFPNTEITDRDLVYDFQAPTDSGPGFRAAAKRLSDAVDGRAWNTETAFAQYRDQLLGIAAGYDSTAPGASRDAGALPDGGTSRALATDDVRRASEPLGPAMLVTRMRADLTVPKLDRDLQLQASVHGYRDQYYRFGTMRRMPTPAACPELHCNPGDTVVDYGGYIVGPYNETLAASTQFDTEYAVGSIASIGRPETTRTLVPGDVPPHHCPGPDGGTALLADGAVVPWNGNVTEYADGAVVADVHARTCGCDTTVGRATGTARDRSVVLGSLALATSAALSARRRRAAARR